MGQMWAETGEGRTIWAVQGGVVASINCLGCPFNYFQR
jgi:hypothetical protein